MKRGAKREIEIKLRVKDLAEMRERFRRIGATLERRVFEANELFDTPSATLRKRGQLLRLRVEILQGLGVRGPLAGARGKEGLGRQQRKGKGREGRQTERSFAALRMTTGAQRYVLTFKGPTQRDRAGQGAQAESLRHSRYKVRAETEYVIPDARGFLALMERSGMRRMFRYEKIRTTYRVPGSLGARLELDQTPCGVFLELEGPRRAIDRLARRLGHGPEDYLTVSYAALHFEACRARGEAPGDMVFRTKKK